MSKNKEQNITEAVERLRLSLLDGVISQIEMLDEVNTKKMLADRIGMTKQLLDHIKNGERVNFPNLMAVTSGSCEDFRSIELKFKFKDQEVTFSSEDIKP
ncbi:MAG: hypothetical protein CME70_03310 [Halobacteriovorax sp.]|nr:hypothetical protein [Halobacteriovorax sp.]MBK23012.1 hypothetical protein [Halobacteriovorax sp.]|tara:strand:- start:59957 stop:60256 length:300 start_codon:yes stop_codon:yes gene_type:complete